MQSVSKNPVLNIVLIVLYLLMGLFAVYWVSHVWVTSYAGDFQIYWGALEKVQAGADPYTPYQVGASFVYHPFILSIFGAFSGWMDWETAFLVWTGLSVLAWIAALMLGWKMVSEEAASEGRSVQGWLPLLLLVGFGPFLETLWVGQINAFLVLSLVLCFYLDRRGRPFLAGVFLAFAVVIKLIPIVLGAYFLVRRAGKLLGGLATGLGVFSLVAFFQWGAAVTVNYLALLPALSGDFVPSIFNLSFQGVLVRLLGEGVGPGFPAGAGLGEQSSPGGGAGVGAGACVAKAHPPWAAHGNGCLAKLAVDEFLFPDRLVSPSCFVGVSAFGLAQCRKTSLSIGRDGDPFFDPDGQAV